MEVNCEKVGSKRCRSSEELAMLLAKRARKDELLVFSGSLCKKHWTVFGQRRAEAFGVWVMFSKNKLYLIRDPVHDACILAHILLSQNQPQNRHADLQQRVMQRAKRRIMCRSSR